MYHRPVAAVPLRGAITDGRNGVTATESKTGSTSFLTESDAAVRLEAIRREMRAERARDHAELRSEMSELRGELRGEMGELRAEMGELRGELRAEMGEFRGEIRTDMEKLRGDMEKLRADLTWRMLLVVGALLAAATALDRLLLA